MTNKLTTRELIVYIILTAAIWCIYGQVTQFDFVGFDDPVYVTQNSHIQSGITWNGLKWAFNTKYFGLWNPLVWLSYMLDYQLYGLKAGGYHLTNLVLHILSSLLLFGLFKRMTGEIWKSAFAAALFALHPLHVESVAWIAERKDVLSAFFWILTLYLYVCYTEKQSIKRYVPVLACFACALMSKPMAVTLPVMMILLDYWPLKRFESGKEGLLTGSAIPQGGANINCTFLAGKIRRILQYTHLPCCAANRTAQRMSIYASRFGFLRALHLSIFEQLLKNRFFNTPIGGAIVWQLKEKAPFFILSAVLIIFTLHIPHDRDLKNLPLDFRFANASVSLITYLQKTLWPQDMAVAYPLPGHIPFWHIAGAVLLLIVISTSVIVMMKRWPYLFVGWLWYIVSIIPVLGIIHIADFAMADRYYYLPSIGIGIGLAWGIPLLFPDKDIRRKILFSAAIAFLFIMSTLTWKQCGYWKNSVELWTHTLRVTKDNALAYNNLGFALFNEGRIEESIDCYNQSLYISKDDYSALNKRGIAYASLGQYKQAISDFSEAIRNKADYAPAFFNRGNAYKELGQYDKAIKDFDNTIRLSPYYTNAYNKRAAVYHHLGNREMSCFDAQKACELGDCRLLKFAQDKKYCR